MTPEQNGAPEAISAELVAIERGQQLKTQEAIAEAERRAELLARITIAAVKRTYPQDWIDFQGSPYLSSAGAERLRTLFGLSITDLETKRYEERDKEGVFWFFVVTGTAHWRGDDFAMMGTCSSRDLFFRTRYQGVDKLLLPAEEVDPTNIVKAAYSNMVANAVTRILGLRDLTWDQLKELGVERGKGGTATFKDRKTPATPSPATDKKPSKVDELEARVRELAGGDEVAEGTILRGVTAFDARPAQDGKAARRGFDGYGSFADLRAKSKNPETVAAIALKTLEQAVAEGRIANPRPRLGPGGSIADEDAQPPEEVEP